MKKQWLLFDGRYRTDEDRAICFEVCDSLDEAQKTAPDYGDDTVIVEFDLMGNELRNGKIIN
jgi:hypothetical protein